MSHFHRKGYIYTIHFSLKVWTQETFHSLTSHTCAEGPAPPGLAQQSRSPSVVARRWRWTWSCCSSSWFGCQSFVMTLSMLRAYTVCVGMASLCTWEGNVSRAPVTLQVPAFPAYKPANVKPEPNESQTSREYNNKVPKQE